MAAGQSDRLREGHGTGPTPGARVYVGSDHAGFELKGHLLRRLAEQGVDVVDVGPAEFDGDDDYPPYCVETGRRVVADQRHAHRIALLTRYEDTGEPPELPQG